MLLILLAITTGLCTGGTALPDQAVSQTDAARNEMVRIPTSTFNFGVEGGEFDEGPVHKVTLSPFEIGKYEVTVADYRVFASETNRKMPKEPKWGWKDNHPIVNVTWTDANAYAEWLSQKTGESYRLPTEAEWYYVASDGGKAIKYAWGNGDPASNIADESAAKNGSTRYWEGYDDKFPYSAPVGSFKPNSLGVYDMGGNAAEWVSNYHYTFTKEPQKDPTGPESGKNKVFKGGSFITNAWYSRIAQRNFMPVTFKNNYLGFRLVKEVVIRES